MKKFLDRLISEEKGQDLIEYALLLAFVALASAALFIGAAEVYRESGQEAMLPCPRPMPHWVPTATP